MRFGAGVLQLDLLHNFTLSDDFVVLNSPRYLDIAQPFSHSLLRKSLLQGISILLILQELLFENDIEVMRVLTCYYKPRARSALISQFNSYNMIRLQQGEKINMPYTNHFRSYSAQRHIF